MSFFKKIISFQWRVLSLLLLVLSLFFFSDQTFAQTYTANEFVTVWKTDNPGISDATSITIPTIGTGNYDIDWTCDGTFDNLGVTGSITHDYGVAGTYHVCIRGTFPQIYFNNAGDKSKILEIKQWGNIIWRSMYGAFYGADNLQLTATDSPNLSQATSFFLCFNSVRPLLVILR